MGAETRVLRIRGRNLQEAFKTAVSQDDYDRGHDLYNGSLSHIHGTIKEVDELPEHIDKYTAVAKCLLKPVSNKNKIKSAVENIPTKGTRKWVTKYVGCDWEGPVNVTKALTKALCITECRKYVEKYPDVKLTVKIVKELESDDTVAIVSYKKSVEERLGEWELMACVPY